MAELNLPAIVAAAVAAFVIGAIWNGLFAGVLAAARPAGMGPAMAPWQLAAEGLRVLVVALAFALVLRTAEVTGPGGALGLGLLVWLGFQAMLLAGAVIWEGLPLRVYAVHAGDALAKTVAMAAILGGWR